MERKSRFLTGLSDRFGMTKLLRDAGDGALATDRVRLTTIYDVGEDLRDDQSGGRARGGGGGGGCGGVRFL